MYDNPRNGRAACSSARRASGSPASAREEGQPSSTSSTEHASQPKYQARFGWAVGDFVLWDNRATWHVAVDDYGDAPRAYRKVIAG